MLCGQSHNPPILVEMYGTIMFGNIEYVEYRSQSLNELYISEHIGIWLYAACCSTICVPGTDFKKKHPLLFVTH